MLILITVVIGASVGSTAAVLLLAIIVVLIMIAFMAVLRPKKKGEVIICDSSIHIIDNCIYLSIFTAVNTGEPYCSAAKTEEPHYATVKSEEDYFTVKSEEDYSTVKSEEPYYSTVNIKRPDACITELEKNNAYEIPPQLPQRIKVEETLHMPVLMDRLSLDKDYCDSCNII